jgi:hypothetical protein
MFGVWDRDPRGDDPNAEPFEIPMHGCGLMSCRKAAWPGFHPQFRGFGGEEGYLHRKFRRRGNRTLCLPFLRWVHRFSRPNGIKYPLRREDRVRNYLIGLLEHNEPTDDAVQHFAQYLSIPELNALLAEFDLPPLDEAHVPAANP